MSRTYLMGAISSAFAIGAIFYVIALFVSALFNMTVASWAAFLFSLLVISAGYAWGRRKERKANERHS